MKLKKLLSLVLCVAMVLSTMSFNVFAEGEEGNIVTVATAEAFQEALDAASDGTIIQLTAGVNYGTVKIQPVEGNKNTITDTDFHTTHKYEYVREVKNLTIQGADGATIDGIEIVTGTQQNSIWYYADIKNLVIDSVTFTENTIDYPAHSIDSPIFISLESARVDGLTVKNCVMDGDNKGQNFVYIYGKQASGSEFETYSKNVTITGNTVSNVARLCELRETENVTISGNTISNTAQHAILFALNSGKAYSGDIEIAGNTADSIGDRFVRMAGAGDATVTIADNEVINYNGGDSDFIKVSDCNSAKNVSIADNTLEGETTKITYSKGTCSVIDDDLVAKIGDTYYLTLADAVAKAEKDDTIVLVADCAEDVTVVQSPDVVFTIDGNNNTMSGSITIDGKSAAYETTGLTIKNVNFDAKSITKDASINFGVSGNNNTRYISNVTVTGCTFTGEGNAKVGIKSYTGGDKNITVENCKATGMHSLAQVKNVVGFTISGCEVEGKNGISVGASTDVSISSCAMTCSGYGVRADASGAYSLTVTGTSIDAHYPVIARNAKDDSGYALTIGAGCEFTSKSGYDIVVTTGDDDEALTKPQDGIKLSIDKTVEASVFSNYVASVDGVCYTTLQDAFAAATSKSTIALLADVDLEYAEWEPVSFGGKFNGNGHTISNLKINKPGKSNIGFITSLNSSFENVIFNNVDVIGGECTGVVAGRAGGSASLAKDITVTGNIKVETTHSGYARAGVIVGGWAYGKYINITVDGIDANTSYIKHTGGGDGRYVAGIVGHADDVDEYTNCVVKNITIDGEWLCGGIAGPGPASSTASGCVVENVKIAADYSGGMFGWYYTPVSEPGLIDGCSVKNIEFTEGATRNGAIGGYAMDTDVVVTNTTIENVVNYGGASLIGFVATVVDKDGNEQSCGTLQAAVDAAGNGDEIILEGDVAETVTVKTPAATYSLRSTPSGITINLNKFTLTGNVIVEAGATVTIKNGTIINTNSGVSAIQTFGTTTLEDVNVTSARHGVRVEGGLTTINSGSYKVGTKGMTTHAVNVSDGGKVIIKDGVFEGPAKTTNSDSGAAVNVQAGSTVEIYGGKFSGGKLSTLAAASNATLVVYEGIFDQDVTAYIAPTSEAIDRKAYEYPYGVAPKAASKINVVLKETDNKNVYDIVITSDGAYDIYEFVSAELVFENNSETVGKAYMDYEIRGYEANGTFAQEAKDAINLADNQEQYIISLLDDAKRLSGDNIIGQVEFFGQGDIDFKVVKGEVDTTWQNTNLGRYYVNDGNAATTDDALVVENAFIDENIPEVHRNVAVNVAFNHKIDDSNYWNGYQITATIKNSAMDFTKTANIDIKDTESGACLFQNVPVGYITVTLKAPGFRTYTYNTTLEETKDNGVLVLNFWNDVKRGNDEAIEKGKAEMANNFLVGDIVMDYTVDKYDLAAVTSYYGMYKLTDADKYIKYDLNRDGNIDIRDVQYVLHTMGN